MTYDYVIVGAGMAADSAIAGIRRHDRQGTILVIGEEPFLPYQRPPLSKKLWTDMRLEEVFLHGTERYGAVLAATTRATELNPRECQVILEDGRSVGYRRLLLATGAKPRRLSASTDSVYYVGSMMEHIRLYTALLEPRQVLVVGGGFIGAEMTAALSARGHQVTWALAEAYPFAGFFPEDLARRVAEVYRHHAVTIAAGVEVVSIESESRGIRAVTQAGEGLTAAVAVLGIGVTPCDELAQAAGLTCANGICVNEQLKTSDSNIWAAGDVAVMDGESLMMHEDHAVTQGRLAGENLAGANKTYTHQSFFYSDLYHLGYEAIGNCSTALEMVEDWVVPGDEGVVYYCDRGRVQGVLNWNVWDGISTARELIADGQRYQSSDLIGRIRNAAE